MRSLRQQESDNVRHLLVCPQTLLRQVPLQELGKRLGRPFLKPCPSASREKDGAGANGVHSDVILGQFPGQRAGKEYLGGLGAAVLRLGPGLPPGYGRYNNYCTLASVLQVWHRRAYGAYRVKQVQVQGLLPLLIAGFKGGRAARPANVAHERIQAPQRFHALRNEMLYVLAVGYVRSGSPHVWGDGAQFLEGLIQTFLVPGAYSHAASFLRQREGCSSTDASTTPGY